MFGVVKSHASNSHQRALRRTLLPAFSAALLATAALAAACGGGDNATTPTIAPPTSVAATKPPAPAVGTVPAVGTSVSGAAEVPPDCETVVPTRDISALIGRTLFFAEGTPTNEGSAIQIICRYLLAKDSPPEQSIQIVLTGYADEATATSQDASFRAAIMQQGGSFTSIQNVGDEGYSFIFPSYSGISARIGTHLLSLGIGKSVSPQPTTEAVTTLAQRILSNVGR